jgi:predicted aspartyl protease
MIHGYLSTPERRPFVHGLLQFPSLDNRALAVEMLIDTGADRTVLGPVDALRLGIDLSTLPTGPLSTGIGGQTPTRCVEATLTLGTFSTALTLTMLAPTRQPLPLPSLLGRDVLAHMALFFDQRTARVLLLQPDEANQLQLP